MHNLSINVHALPRHQFLRRSRSGYAKGLHGAQTPVKVKDVGPILIASGFEPLIVELSSCKDA